MPTAEALKDIKQAGPVVIRHPLPKDVEEKLKITPDSAAMHKWNELNGAPGALVGGIEAVPGGWRQRYKSGAIYVDTKYRTRYVYGAIGDRYDGIGGPQSWLGFPTSDEQPMSENGRATTFANGTIYFWPDVGPIEINNVVVHYTGLACAGVTNELSASDEPYVVIGVVSPQGESTVRSQIYSKVQAGQGRPDWVEIYRGPPLGITISTLLMEHDEDDPDKYKEAMEKSVEAAGAGLDTAIALIPGIGPPLALVCAPLIAAVAPKIGDALNDLLGLTDDDLGQDTMHLTAKQMIVLATHTPVQYDKTVPFKVGTPLFHGQTSTYAVHYGLDPAQ